MSEIIIGDILFTPKKRVVSRSGNDTKIRNKESEILTLLCHHYPDSISREVIEKEIWTGSYVTDNTLTQTISNLRNALDDKNHELVITIPKKGYSLGVKPNFSTSDTPVIKNVVLGNVAGERRKSFLRGIDFFDLKVTLATLLSCFIILFLLSYDHHQVKVVDVKSLPILINLDKVIDANFLSSYQREPYVLLKKRENGDYIVCQIHEGALVCEKI
ncbi:winged helix-turn-helix domain-containing protein [Yersinia aldovae]|uniref:Reguatory protein n=1 Tax=Yersinia aldovae TaxID=29483 RepID=A0ABP1YTZ4_YERAL|nr:winged helix-turn-helix domain-containing protein [Yersinia aldovae]CNL21946.1 reguatory protein [Yersinia aldovae]